MKQIGILIETLKIIVAMKLALSLSSIRWTLMTII